MASLSSADAKKKKAEATKAFLAAKYEKMKTDRAAKSARRAKLEERMTAVGLDDAQKSAARTNLRKEEASDMRESRKRLGVRDFVRRAGKMPGIPRFRVFFFLKSHNLHTTHHHQHFYFLFIPSYDHK